MPLCSSDTLRWLDREQTSSTFGNPVVAFQLLSVPFQAQIISAALASIGVCFKAHYFPGIEMCVEVKWKDS
eukprot:1161765-Pelagomonas_calceolata.AAC.1